jgi:pimeloyl-ACP methyl ester carboxylesterase
MMTALLTAACSALAVEPLPIKRQAFTVETAAALQAEFQRRQLVLAGPVEPPSPGQTTRISGTGPSGIPSHFSIDNVAGRFHVYAERHRPQHPASALPYQEQEVVFDTPDPGVSPVGTLTYPSQGGPFPGVVLIAGTGAHTRDAGMSLHKTFLVLADHLTRQGFAVLRYDKRGVGLTGGEAHPGPTTDDYAADALAALRFLKVQPQVDGARVGLLGHSEGATIATMVAAQAPGDVRFVVMLAGMGLTGIDLKSLQDAAERRADGMPEPLVLANEKQERELFEIAASPLGRPQALAAMGAATRALPADVKTQLEIPPEGPPDEAFDGLLTPWLRRFLVIDPRVYLEQLKCPVLALIGSKDLQVPPQENLPAIERALKRGGNARATVLQLPDLNHAFQTARTGKASEYLLIEETFAPSALRLIADWMVAAAR